MELVLEMYSGTFDSIIRVMKTKLYYVLLKKMFCDGSISASQLQNRKVQSYSFNN